MSDKAIEVINHAARELDISMPFGEAILAALKAAEIELVELPESGAEVRHEGDLFAFPNETHCDVRVTWSRQVVYDNDWMAASEAQSLAAALLAAANAAGGAKARAARKSGTK